MKFSGALTSRNPISQLRALSYSCLIFVTISAAHAQAPTPLRISVQPGNYSMLAMHVATKNNFWSLAGLNPSFVRYPAGVPQIKGNADWDIGLTGAVPALLGAKDFGMIAIAVADDQSRTNALMASKETIAKIKKDKAIPRGTKIAVTLNSTADYAVQTCLALWGGRNKSEMVYQGASQSEAIQAGASGAVEMVGLWAPNVYTMQEKHGFETLCSAKDFSPGLYNVAITKRDFASKNPETVAKFLAVMMRSIQWMKANPEGTQAFFVKNADDEGVKINISAAKSDFTQRPLFDLNQQLGLIGETAVGVDESALGRSFFSINVFLNEGKAGTRTMRPSSFMDPAYLKLVKTTPNLLKIASLN
jgi:ABC-type nitrate/sulfonate/bicarbonate transport system substrate-binding protein